MGWDGWVSDNGSRVKVWIGQRGAPYLGRVVLLGAEVLDGPVQQC
jgi:hypothetical protein